MKKEQIKEVDPKRTYDALQGVQNNSNCVVLSCNLTVTINGTDEDTSEKIIHLIKEFSKLSE